MTNMHSIEEVKEDRSKAWNWAVYIEPKTAEAAKLLRDNRQKLKRKFRGIHESLGYDDTGKGHGLRFADEEESFFAFVPLHESYGHVVESKSDTKRTLKDIIGSAKGYNVYFGEH